jgi:hypothetical protein
VTPMALLGLTVPTPGFPGGNAWPVAVVFLCHVAVAEYSVGAITLATAMEAFAARSQRLAARGGGAAAEATAIAARRYARNLGRSYYLVFSLGATLAVFAVVLLIGVWANAFGLIVNVFLPLVGIAFGLFLILTPLLVWYRHSFETMTAGRHSLLGLAVTFWQTLFVVLIVGIDTYLITPDHAGLFDASLNPPYWPLLVHRLIGNVSWAALFLAGFAAWKGRRAIDPIEQEFQAWAARVNLRIGLATALFMPIDGFVLVEVIHRVQPGYFDNLVGTYGNLMVAQEILVGIVLVGGNIALGAEAGATRSPLALTATGLTLAGMVVACLPAAVLSADIIAVRYIGLGVAVLVTSAHLLLRMRGPRVSQVAVTPRGSTLRRSLVAVGVASAVTALFMGYIKEHARGEFAIYGELQQKDAGGNFNAPGNLYP